MASAPKKPVKKPSVRRVSVKAPPKRRTERTPVVYDGFLETLGRRDESTRLSVFESARLGQALLIERSQERPVTWAVLSKRYGMGIRRLQRLHAKVMTEQTMHSDPTGLSVLTETLRLYEESIAELATIAQHAENDSNRIGALRLMLEAVERRVTLLSGMGRMPRSFRAVDELAMLSRLIRTFVEKLERHDIPHEIVEEFVAMLHEVQPVIEGSPRALTAG